MSAGEGGKGEPGVGEGSLLSKRLWSGWGREEERAASRDEVGVSERAKE